MSLSKYYVDENGEFCIDVATVSGKAVKARAIGCLNEHWFKLIFEKL